LGKSPAYVVQLELSETPPGVSEETLVSLAGQLELSPDLLMTLASKVPAEAQPETELELQLFRQIKRLAPEEQEALLRNLTKDPNRAGQSNEG
jgi:hypothetical protein